MKVLTDRGAAVEAIEADLSTTRGVDALLARLVDRRVDALLANAGTCQEQNTSTLYLVRSIARSMRKRGQGKILITGSIPGCRTLRKELKDSGVTVSCLTAMSNGEGEVVQYPPAPPILFQTPAQ
jgi:hypothetical protein